MAGKKRQAWGSRLGVIMAVAGSAVGLGNFLRFPVQAASNGGGAFMIPYFISLFLLGVPLMWVEWTMGRYGGGFGHGTAPGIFHSHWQKARFIKYFGVIGIFGPLVIFIYYTYIESWTLAYSYFSLIGRYQSVPSQSAMKGFLESFQGLAPSPYFNGIRDAYFFFILTFLANMAILYFGVKGGIERLCVIGMPVLFVCAIAVTVRVLMLGAPSPERPDWNVINGLGFLWNPDFKMLKDAKVWLAAAGQIFFTLGVGIGVILTYASYLSKRDDVVLSSLSATSANEFAEVVLGGSIVIPAAFAFFGPSMAQEIAKGGAFNLGFVTMPLIFQKLAFGQFFGFLWFFLLFIAGITSSVSLAEPAVAFLEDEFDISRQKAVVLMGGIAFILCQFPIFFLKHGVVDELDFWGGTFMLVLFALVETFLFAWVFGMDKAWEEIHHGADLHVPPFYKFIIKFVTPGYLLFILGFWFFQQGISTILLKGVPRENLPYVVGTRAGLTLLLLALAFLVRKAWRKRKPVSRKAL